MRASERPRGEREREHWARLGTGKEASVVGGEGREEQRQQVGSGSGQRPESVLDEAGLALAERRQNGRARDGSGVDRMTGLPDCV